MTSSSDVTRELALAAGELHGKLMEPLNAYFKLADSDRAKQAYEALTELQTQKMVTADEASQLKTLLEATRRVTITRPQVAEVAEQVHAALIQMNAGPVALALA